MRIHRTQHERRFTVLSNAVLQDRRLSYTARGLLADLLSRPDGWREDGRHMADTSTQGRGAIRRALKELTEAGYYRVEKIRMADGTVRSEAHLYDTPQLVRPDVTRPVSGEADAEPADIPEVKEPGKDPTLPGEVDPAIRAAVATLFRVIRPEPRLRLGPAEAVGMAPLVARWLERGSTADDLARALLPGLPPVVHSPVALLRSRLERKLPAVHTPAPPRPECARCHDPVRGPGICRACAGLEPRPAAASRGRAETAVAGAARVRAALRVAFAAG